MQWKKQYPAVYSVQCLVCKETEFHCGYIEEDTKRVVINLPSLM